MHQISGFDKVYITSLFLDHPEKVKSISRVIGVQSLGICLPYQCVNGQYFLWDYRSKRLSDIPLKNTLKLAIDSGAGEILLYDVQSDGSLEGLNLSIYDELDLELCSIPILLAGGAGKQEHFSIALSQPKIQGIVAGSIFALTDSTPLTIRQHCLDSGIPMRRP